MDPLAVKERMMLSRAGANYPAGHNVGGQYCAESTTLLLQELTQAIPLMRGGEDV